MNAPLDKIENNKPPRWQAALFRARHVLLALYVVLLGGFVGVVYWNDGEVSEAILVVLVLLGVQAGFLAGAPHFTWPRPRRKRSMIVSKVFAAALAALLTFGFGATLVSGLDLMRDKHVFQNLDPRFFIYIPLALWAGWCVLFLLIWTGEWLPLFRRVYKLLVAGTILELLITIPVDVQVRKRTSCYCDQGTFFALVIGVTILIWSFGPGIVFLYFTRRMQQRSTFGYCTQCGYDLRGLPEPRCPECGTPLNRDVKTESIHPVPIAE